MQGNTAARRQGQKRHRRTVRLVDIDGAFSVRVDRISLVQAIATLAVVGWAPGVSPELDRHLPQVEPLREVLDEESEGVISSFFPHERGEANAFAERGCGELGCGPWGRLDVEDAEGLRFAFLPIADEGDDADLGDAGAALAGDRRFERGNTGSFELFL